MIPCSIQNMDPKNALADLGASINVMSSNIFDKLNLSRLKPTRLTLRLADGTTRYPEGLAEDVIVRIGKFLVSVNFIVCKMGDDDPHESLILGRPFLATCRARKDVSSGEITLRFDGQATNDEKENAKEELDEDERAKVKAKMKPKPKWKNDKLTWKNTWVPKCFLPTTKEYG
ncbi:retropepsin-like aspartic protease [Providencia rettgeri]